MAIVNRAAKKAQKKADESKVVAFMNWGALNKHGEIAIKGNKGFSIFDNSYTTKAERQLVDLATKAGGEITMNMVVTIRLNKADEAPELNPADFI